MKLLKILLFLSLAGANVTDYDGNVCETVLIGEQLWMAENLKVTHYRNGDDIPTGLDNDAWSSTTEGAFAIYDDDPTNAEINVVDVVLMVQQILDGDTGDVGQLLNILKG